MIPQETVQQIIHAADIVDVVNDYVSLKKRGANMIACCPFHNEKTPSFYVSPSKQIYKCFGCGKGGDSVRFVMDLDGLSYPEALRTLAKKYGIEIQEREITDEELQAQNEKDSLYLVLDFAKGYYQQQLFESEEGRSIGLSYFKERGFTENTLKTFDLGYSPDGWNTFTEHAIKKGYTIDTLEKAGLSIIKEGKDPIDRFRGRVMFPIHSVSGKPIAFGARILKNDPKAPKYLNSPETPVYHKSYVLYGISYAKKAIRVEDVCLLVEGYTDVVSMSQAGIENVVASSGTSLTKEQIQLVRRFTNNITVLYDGDPAGIKASLRGIDLILEEGLDVKVVIFPDGEDPDSFVKRVGNQAFKNHIKETQQDFIRFKTKMSLQDVGNDPIKRANLITDLVQTVAKIPDSIKRAVFTKEVAGLLEIDEQVLITEGNKIFRKTAENKERDFKRNNRERSVQVGNTNLPVAPAVPSSASQSSSEEVSKKTVLSYQEEECVRLMVCYGTEVIERNQIEDINITLVDYVFQEIRDMKFIDPVYATILQTFRHLYEKGEIPTVQYFSGHQDEQIQQVAVSWLATKHQLSINWSTRYDIHVTQENEILAEMAFTNILRLKKSRFEHDIIELTNQLINETDVEKQEDIIIQMMNLKNVVKKIAEILGTVVQG
jgi:DNA primase